jgi:hypothetical protein
MRANVRIAYLHFQVLSILLKLLSLVVEGSNLVEALVLPLTKAYALRARHHSYRLQ